MLKISDSKTKIIATLGPASSNKVILEKMIEAGLDVFRLNFSHGNYKEKSEIISLIRTLEAEHKVNIAILADLQGPKIRLGDIDPNGVLMEEGKTILFTTNSNSKQNALFINYEDFAINTLPGHQILIDDGKIKLEVTKTNGKDLVTAKVLCGGVAHQRKGVNLPDTNISLPNHLPCNQLQCILHNNIYMVFFNIVVS